MSALSLPASTIAAIVDDPTIISHPLSASSPSSAASSLAALGLSADVAARVLGAYVRGFRTIFLLSTGLNAAATLAAIFMIKHTELSRGDEDELRAQALAEEAKAAALKAHKVADADVEKAVDADEKKMGGNPGSA